MKKYLIVLILSVIDGLVTGSNSSDFPCGIENRLPQTRIIGGKLAKLNQFPWLTLIFLDHEYLCSGALISDQWVLTAAHCTYGFKTFDLFLGVQNYLNHKEPHRIHMISSEKRTHPGYEHDRYRYDIALIKLPKPVELSRYVRPVCLPTYADQAKTFDGVKVVIAGFGKTSDDDDDPTHRLHFARDVKVISNLRCVHSWPLGNDIYESNICIEAEKEDPKTTCSGDSGSSLNYAEHAGGPYKTIGVTSFMIGKSCLDTKYPHANARVTSFLEWIESTSGIQIDP